MFSPKVFRAWDKEEKKMIYGQEGAPLPNVFAWSDRYVPMQFVCLLQIRKKKSQPIFEGDVIVQHPFANMSLPVVIVWNPKTLGFAGLPLWKTEMDAERVTLERILDGSAMNEGKIAYGMREVFEIPFDLKGNVFETDWSEFLPKEKE